MFKPAGVESVGQRRWTRESDTSRADAAVTVKVALKDDRYAGEAIVKQTNFGIEFPEKRASEPTAKSN
jgi:hypothetical protein